MNTVSRLLASYILSPGLNSTSTSVSVNLQFSGNFAVNTVSRLLALYILFPGVSHCPCSFPDFLLSALPS